MSSGDLIPNDHDHVKSAANEVQFALVISRMIDTVNNSPEHMRQAVYDLARYKLTEQFTDADATNIQRAQQALETAIRGVEDSQGSRSVPRRRRFRKSATAPPRTFLLRTLTLRIGSDTRRDKLIRSSTPHP